MGRIAAAAAVTTGSALPWPRHPRNRVCSAGRLGLPCDLACVVPRSALARASGESKNAGKDHASLSLAPPIAAVGQDHAGFQAMATFPADAVARILFRASHHLWVLKYALVGASIDEYTCN